MKKLTNKMSMTLWNSFIRTKPKSTIAVKFPFFYSTYEIHNVKCIDIVIDQTPKEIQLIYVGGIADAQSDILQVCLQIVQKNPNFLISTFDCTRAKNPKDQIEIVNQIYDLHACKQHIIFGFSLGTFVAIQSASTKIQDSILLNSPFVKASDVSKWAKYFSPIVSYVAGQDLNNVEAIQNIARINPNVNIIVILKNQDQSVPPEKTKLLVDLMRQYKLKPKVLSQDGPHEVDLTIFQ